MPVSLQLFDVSFAQTLHCTTIPGVLLMVLVTLPQLTVPLIGVHVSFNHVPVLFVLSFDQTGGVVSLVLSSLIMSALKSYCEGVDFMPFIFIFQLPEESRKFVGFAVIVWLFVSVTFEVALEVYS